MTSAIALALALVLALTGGEMTKVIDVLLQTGRHLDALVEGMASAQGSLGTLKDSRLAVFEPSDDAFVGGPFFLKTNPGIAVAAEVVATVPGGQYYFSHTLAHLRPEAGTIQLTEPGDAAIYTDDQGEIVDPYGVWVDDSRPSGTYDFNLTTIQLGDPAIRPGTLEVFSFPGGARVLHEDAVLNQDGTGNLIRDSNGTIWGTVNYTDASVTRTGPGLGDCTRRYIAAATVGKINYITGLLQLWTINNLNSGNILVSYHYSNPNFLPVIQNVTDYAASTGTLTFDNFDPMLDPVSAYATYGVMSRRYPRWLLFSKLNEVLSEMQVFASQATEVAVSALTDGVETALADTERVIAVWGGRSSGAREWRAITEWKHAQGRLRITSPLTQFDVVRIVTLGVTSPIVQTNDVVDGQYSPEWLALATAQKCVRWRLSQPGADTQLLTLLLNDLMTREQRERSRLRMWEPRPQAVTAPVVWVER